jgi:hypothetical protein
MLVTHKFESKATTISSALHADAMAQVTCSNHTVQHNTP